MYPYKVIFGVDLYTVLLCAGILSAIIVFRVLSDKQKLSAGLQNLCLVSGICGIGLGYFSAIVFQALYNLEKNGGKFILDKSTGTTFYGGLLGGAAVFLLIYFVAGGLIFKGKEHLSEFYNIADTAMCSVSVAHALGRLGCLTAGCCHGPKTDAWCGIKMYIDGEWQKAVPTQLFEALFLLALFAYFTYRVCRKKGHCLEMYMCFYGVWRFFIEYLRDDYRGSTLVSFLTPSQLVAILMIGGGVALAVIRKKTVSKDKQQS